MIYAGMQEDVRMRGSVYIDRPGLSSVCPHSATLSAGIFLVILFRQSGAISGAKRSLGSKQVG
jgi:hypothetical protein